MKILELNILKSRFKEAVYDLWNKEYPQNLAYFQLSDFDNYLAKLEDQSHLLLVDEQGLIKGWYFDFIRENEPWFAMILDSKIQGKGWGTQLLNLAKENADTLNGWVIDHDRDLKVDGSVYKSPLAFYKKNGFDLIASERLELENISAVKIKWKNSFTH